jgi:hypothetical protein
MSKGLRKLHLCIDRLNMSGDEKRDALRLLVKDGMLAKMREVEWAGRPPMLGPSTSGFIEHDPPWRGHCGF